MKTFTSNCTLNHESTLADLLAYIGEVKKAEKTPTPKKLAESGSTVIAEETGCLAYSCGYAVYDNGSGRTVMWLPDCVSFTYYFDEATDAEKGIIPDKDTLPDGLLEMLPWVMAVTLIGEHRIEANSMNRTGSRSGTKDYDSDDNGDKDGDAEAALEKTYEKAYVWREDRIGESPETIFIRKETRREMLESMTDKQREVFTLYYYDGLKQREIAERLGISRDSVNDRLECALKKVKKLF
ncbi:MAG TPA: sigma-70 family RNA polymerase sigma factor [Ruminococcus flavefaciens]|jgi:RNA polymerase sigma factor (sigma-70 family)|nr:sigma-70 family RNA polymerase sigma factor [Ruminococcus flavefaciens]